MSTSKCAWSPAELVIARYPGRGQHARILLMVAVVVVWFVTSDPPLRYRRGASP